jgi:hypothetical protein
MKKDRDGGSTNFWECLTEQMEAKLLPPRQCPKTSSTRDRKDESFPLGLFLVGIEAEDFALTCPSKLARQFLIQVRGL